MVDLVLQTRLVKILFLNSSSINNNKSLFQIDHPKQSAKLARSNTKIDLYIAIFNINHLTNTISINK